MTHILSAACIAIAACGGGDSPDVVECGSGTYTPGPLGDPHRACAVTTHKGGTITFSTDVQGLSAGSHFWRYRVGIADPVTGTGEGQLTASPGEEVTIEALVAAPRGGATTWSGAGIVLR